MVKIQKNGAFLVVHESVFAEHEQLGWVFVEDVIEDGQPGDDLSKLTVEKLKEMLEMAGGGRRQGRAFGGRIRLFGCDVRPAARFGGVDARQRGNTARCAEGRGRAVFNRQSDSRRRAGGAKEPDQRRYDGILRRQVGTCGTACLCPAVVEAAGRTLHPQCAG